MIMSLLQDIYEDKGWLDRINVLVCAHNYSPIDFFLVTCGYFIRAYPEKG
jgi:hypothetical protein